MYYYISAWNKLSKIANIFTASWEFICMAGSSSPTHLDFRKVPIYGDFVESELIPKGLGKLLILFIKSEHEADIKMDFLWIMPVSFAT